MKPHYKLLANGERVLLSSAQAEARAAEPAVYNNSFSGFQIRSVVIDRQRFWAAKDICLALGCKDYSHRLARIPASMRRFTELQTASALQQMVVINRQGVGQMLAGSRKPKVKQFLYWLSSGMTLEQIAALAQDASPVTGSVQLISPPRVYFEGATTRLKSSLRVSNDKDVAEALGMSKNSFCEFKKRGAFPFKSLCLLAFINPDIRQQLDFILFGAAA